MRTGNSRSASHKEPCYRNGPSGSSLKVDGFWQLEEQQKTYLFNNLLLFFPLSQERTRRIHSFQGGGGRERVSGMCLCGSPSQTLLFSRTPSVCCLNPFRGSECTPSPGTPGWPPSECPPPGMWTMELGNNALPRHLSREASTQMSIGCFPFWQRMGAWRGVRGWAGATPSCLCPLDPGWKSTGLGTTRSSALHEF